MEEFKSTCSAKLLDVVRKVESFKKDLIEQINKNGGYIFLRNASFADCYLFLYADKPVSHICKAIVLVDGKLSFLFNERNETMNIFELIQHKQTRIVYEDSKDFCYNNNMISVMEFLSF